MEKDLLEVEKFHFNELREEYGEEEFNNLMKEFLTTFTYESITIEGKNGISKDKVAEILATESISDSLPEREQKEALNYARAFKHVQKLVSLRRKMDEDIIKDLHEMIMDGIVQGGHYRQVNVQLKNSMHQPPNYTKVYDRMEKFIYDLEHFRGTTVQKAAFAHASILKVHPFLDGNGRLARLLLNYVLMFDGYMPVSIPLTEKDVYRDALDKFKVEKDLSPFATYIYNQLLNAYETYISALEN
jgi:Fic family protein